MMRILTMGSLAALAVLSASAMWMTSATAQQATQTPCGPGAFSTADQRQVVPCTPPTTKADSGEAGCGVSTWSTADQRNVVMPCTSGAGASTPAKTEGAEAKVTCGVSTWSTSDQRNVVMPCTQ